MIMAARPDFWISSGYGLTPPNAEGHLPVTDALISAYLSRPELAPVAESCAIERAVHADLMENPRQQIETARLDAFEDQDARYNFEVFLNFRDLLVQAGTLEAAYR
ncbi:MAG TPA: hypothetical protein DCG04_17140, partial [Rhodospirillaceae bacterium]|nr:hypothetical protein [Rhodospirillaceae bacterium]